ncbi:MAG: hypothetical protein VX705_10270 [Verrucomicrobiota bacterium]|nr:hypothetical protein [Verrucomicrobiota bacterium]
MSETAIRPVTADVGDGAPSRLGTAIGGGVALVVLGALVWWFFLRGIGPEVQANMLEMRSDGLWYEADKKKPFTGTAVNYFPFGGVDTKTEIRDGRLHGTQTQWSPKGKKVVEQEWRAGLMHGRMREWSEYDILRHEMNSKEGLKHGRETFWYENGKKWHEVKFMNGREDGVAIWWHDNGQKQRLAVFDKGVRQGRETQWYKEGQKMAAVLWKDDRLMGATCYLPDGTRASGITNGTGVFLTHYIDGRKQSEDHYRDGVRNGPAKTWHDGGILHRSTLFENGLRHGAGTEWHSNGKVAWKATWTNGVVVSRQFFTRDGKPAPDPNPGP